MCVLLLKGTLRVQEKCSLPTRHIKIFNLTDIRTS